MSGTHRWRTPRQDGGILAEPPPQELGRLLDENRRRLAAVSLPLLGRSLAELRQQARREALAAATSYLLSAGEPLPPIPSESLLLAGHQPELFHPGVWVKNFALNGLGAGTVARRSTSSWTTTPKKSRPFVCRSTTTRCR